MHLCGMDWWKIVIGSKNAKEAWESLANHFEEKTQAEFVLEDCCTMQSWILDMVAHINHVKTIADQLEALEDAQIKERNGSLFI